MPPGAAQAPPLSFQSEAPVPLPSLSLSRPIRIHPIEARSSKTPRQKHQSPISAPCPAARPARAARSAAPRAHACPAHTLAHTHPQALVASLRCLDVNTHCPCPLSHSAPPPCPLACRFCRLFASLVRAPHPRTAHLFIIALMPPVAALPLPRRPAPAPPPPRCPLAPSGPPQLFVHTPGACCNSLPRSTRSPGLSDERHSPTGQQAAPLCVCVGGVLGTSLWGFLRSALVCLAQRGPRPLERGWEGHGRRPVVHRRGGQRSRPRLGHTRVGSCRSRAGTCRPFIAAWQGGRLSRPRLRAH